MVTGLIDEQRVLSSCCSQNECGTGEGRSARLGFQGLPAKSAALFVVPAARGCYRWQVSVRRAVHSLALDGPALTWQAWYAKAAGYILPL